MRIPASVLAASHVRLDVPVDVREEHGQIIIEPIRPTDYLLASLIDGITDQWQTIIHRKQAISCGCNSIPRPDMNKPAIVRRSS